MRFPLSIPQPLSTSLSPTHFTQNAFLSFIFFFHLASSSSHLSSSSLPLSIFWTFLLVPSISLRLLFSLLFPRWWMSLSAGCSSYLLSRGAHTVSLSHPPRLYPWTKEIESGRGYRGGGGEEGGHGQGMHSRSHHYHSWHGWEHISPDQHSFSLVPLQIVRGERNLPYLLTSLSKWWY